MMEFKIGYIFSLFKNSPTSVSSKTCFYLENFLLRRVFERKTILSLKLSWWFPMKWSNCFWLSLVMLLSFWFFWWSAKDFGAWEFSCLGLFGAKTWALSLISSLMIFFIVRTRIWIITSSRWKLVFNFDNKSHSNRRFKPFLCNKSLRLYMFDMVSEFSMIFAIYSMVCMNILSIDELN